MAKAGDELDAWCTKCRLDLLHRVVATVAGAPKRVECETCHSQHNYRAPKGGSVLGPKNPKKPSTRSAKSAPKATDWQQQVAGKERSLFAPYAISARFAPQQLISHKKFGDGVVMAVVEDQKINVLFRDGPRILIHNRG